MKPRSIAGFTLVEILIAVTLLALLMLGVGGALTTFAKTSQSLDARIDDGEEMTALSELLYGILPAMVRGQPAASNLPTPGFLGRPHELLWLGILPARYGAGGVQVFRLAEFDAGGKPALGLWFAPFIPGADPLQLLPDQPVFRLDGLRDFHVSYRDRQGSVWREAWNDPALPPAQIALRIATDRGPWPDVVVAPELLDSGRPGSGEIVIGGVLP